ncbi:MAG: TIGR03960 family B12-binding radical SAM protein [Thermaerobacter sp.]|nr:TIGR03960 family B12-binding radical SAM protein [Thermaerobacter sp.]
MIPKVIESILPRVLKPARYIGGEVNAVRKDKHSVEVRVALAFPDVYEVGMSHLGLKVLYKAINDLPYAAAERTFAPWVDMAALMRASQVKLYSLETFSPLDEFDVLGFTLQYELSYTNILGMLDLAGIPLLSADRKEQHPLVIVGGPCAYNAEPLADFVDLVVLGEGEEVIVDILEVLRQGKAATRSREATLNALAEIKGVYVPSFYEPLYGVDEAFRGLRAKETCLPTTIEKRVVAALGIEHIPVAPVLPYLDIVHDRVLLEIFRGCARGCRFCQAGMTYRPVREFNSTVLVAAAQQAILHTGYEEVSLASLSTMDHSNIGVLVKDLVDKFSCQGINISLPSLRVDSFSVSLAADVAKVRKSGITLAPEAGSQRLRDVINKQVTGEALLEALHGAKNLGFRSVKLYFMLGLPTETYADLDEMLVLISRAARILPLTVSVSSFVPKPFTPFQWEPQCSMQALEERQSYLKERLRKDKRVKFVYHEATTSFLEAVFSRGDRRLGKVLLDAYRRGCTFDAWSEHFRFDLWMEAFAEVGLDAASFANRERLFAEVLPWEHLSPGVSKEFLWQERERSRQAALTGDCASGSCEDCGVCPALRVGTITERGRRE